MLTTSGTEWAVGGELLDALAARDFTAIAACLAPDVRMRALVPRGPFELVGPADVRARFEMWFGGDERFELLDASIGDAGSRLYVRWRIRLTSAATGEARVAEQHAFVGVNARVETIDLLCSGWVPEPAAR